MGLWSKFWGLFRRDERKHRSPAELREWQLKMARMRDEKERLRLEMMRAESDISKKRLEVEKERLELELDKIYDERSQYEEEEDDAQEPVTVQSSPEDNFLKMAASVMLPRLLNGQHTRGVGAGEARGRDSGAHRGDAENPRSSAGEHREGNGDAARALEDAVNGVV